VSRPLASFFLSAYAPVALAVFEVLTCQTVGSFHVVAAAPALSCASGVYRAYAVLAYVVLAVVVVGMPVAASIVLLRFGRWLKAQEVRDRIGFLFETYRPACFWWEVVVLLRRAALAALAMVVAQPLRMYLVAVCTFVIFVAHLVFRPFADSADNAVEAVGLLGLLFLAFTRASALFLVGTSSSAIVFGVAAAVPFLIIVGAILYQSRAILVDALAILRWVFCDRCRVARRPAVLGGLSKGTFGLSDLPNVVSALGRVGSREELAEPLMKPDVYDSAL
jgi:hypothetical protein